MIRAILLLAIVLFVGCGSPEVAGGVSEAGNGYIQITVVMPDNTPVSNCSVVLTPPNYEAQSEEILLAIDTTDTAGATTTLSRTAGVWNIYAERGTEALSLTSCELSSKDTLNLTVTISAPGVIESDSSVRSISLEGAPKRFPISQSRATVPAGTFTVTLRDSSDNLYQQATVVLPGSVTKVEPDYSSTTIDESPISSVYNVAFDGDSVIAYATGSGAVIERHGVRQSITAENSPLLSNWIRDVVVHEDTVIVATDSGIALFSESDTLLFRAPDAIPSDWVIHFLEIENELWFVTNKGVGTMRNGVIDTLFTAENSPLPATGTTSLAEDPAGGVLIGTHYGVYRYFQGNWQQDTTRISPSSSVSSTAIGGTWNDLWFATNGAGLFHKEGSIWTQYTDSTSSLSSNVIHALSVNDGTVRFGGTGKVLHEGSGEPFAQSVSLTSDIISLNHRNDGSLWIGTLYSGVTVIMK